MKNEDFLNKRVAAGIAERVLANQSLHPAWRAFVRYCTELQHGVTGKGFKIGANAKWFVTGTTNPGGVTVNSTTFVSSTELTANITVADTAVIAQFDIQVLNTDLSVLFMRRDGSGLEIDPIQNPRTANVKSSALPKKEFPHATSYHSVTPDPIFSEDHRGYKPLS